LPVVLAVAAVMSFLAQGTGSAQLTRAHSQDIFSKYQKAVVQVRVISVSSGEKSGLGSGFFISDQGVFATNYHVIADAALYPSLFSIEYKRTDGTAGTAEILNLDPVHDLAILKADQPSPDYFILGDSQMDKGTMIFAFGNPYDLGMIVVDGLYNGVMDHAMYRKILFSGALNPGMSGGPAVKDDGKVFGVNVASAGNDISFFVPVEYLSELFQEFLNNDEKTLGPFWKMLIQKRIVLQNEAFLKELLAQET